MAAKKAETKGGVVALTDAESRKRALEVALGKIEKDFGKGSVMELIKKSGAFYSYNGERIGQGRDNTRQFLLDHPDIFDDLDRQIREKMVQNPIEPVPAESVPLEGDEDDEIDLDDDGEFVLDA